MRCIACGFPITYPFFQPEKQPLAALYLPRSAEDALNAPRYPMDFHACADCGHVFNVAFKYAEVPYEDNTNRMFNAGSGWQVYMDTLVGKLSGHYDLSGKTFVEIGSGNGHFLSRIKHAVPTARCIGFEPGIEARNTPEGVEAVEDYFIAERDLPKYTPDFLICRHVLEHLEQPHDFVADIAYWCHRHGVSPVFIGECPRIDKALRDARINDYLYEHVSNFTRRSFTRMFETAGYAVEQLWSDYGEEVVVACAKPIQTPHRDAIQSEAARCHTQLTEQIARVTATLDALRKDGKKVAFWGGTGKSASFLNYFSIDAKKFPLVVDSDPDKCGFYVPGTGQLIQPPDVLAKEMPDVIVITTQWRAKDIYDEIQRRNIACKEMMVVLKGTLVPYHGEVI